MQSIHIYVQIGTFDSTRENMQQTEISQRPAAAADTIREVDDADVSGGKKKKRKKKKIK